MNTFYISDLKKELQHQSAEDLAALCLLLAKYKKDNKDFLGYLLFDSHDKPNYVAQIKTDLDEQFELLAVQGNLYYVKKSLRKILRNLNKYCKYTNDKTITCDLHIYFCRQIIDYKIDIRKSQLLLNLFEQQIKKIHKLISQLHEDLQSDYLSELEALKF